LTELEWRRVRRRFTMPHVFAMLCNVGPAFVIFVIRHASPVFAR
jgi:hypothetical protein